MWDFATVEIRSNNSVHSIIEPIMAKLGIIEPGKIPDTIYKFIHMVQDIEQAYEKQPKPSTILNDIIEAMFQQFDSDITISKKQDSVTIMSIWESRGLQFPIVFIPGMVRDFFPARHPSRQLLYGEELDSVRTFLREIDLPGTVTLEKWRDQEKQLLYIAMTRAKEKLYLTLAKSYQYGDDFEPSPFISELLEGKELSSESCSQYQINYHDHIISNNIKKLPSPDELITKSDVEITFLRYIKETQHLDPRLSQEAIKFTANNGIKGNIISPDPIPESPIPQVSARKFSYSSIRTFLSCPRKYFFDNLLKVESDRNASSGFGTLIHQVLGIFHTEYPDMRKYGYEELWESINKTLNKLWNDKQFIQNRLQSRSYRLIAQEVLRNYLNGEYKRWENGRSCKTTETPFDFNIDKYTLTGRIDRIDDCLEAGNEIIDFKITSSSEAESALKAKFLNIDDDPDYKPQDYQLPIYYYAKLTDLNVIKLVVYQLRTYSKRDEGPFRREIEILDQDTRSRKNDKFITKADLESVKDDILKTLDTMTFGNYPPEPREYRECNMCNFAFICDREREFEENWPT